MKSRSFILLTTSSFGGHLAQGLIRAGHKIVGVGRGVSKDSAPVGAVSKEKLEEILGRTVCVTDLSIDDEQEVCSFLNSISVDFVLVSWPKLFSPEALTVIRSKIIGTHPTPLPLGRGRHPLQWMRVLGIRSSKLSAFWLDARVDHGSLVSQVSFKTSRGGDINSDLAVIEKKAGQLGFVLGVKFLGATPNGRPQSLELATHFRARQEKDSFIDFRMSSTAIVNHVKSFKSPWPQAMADIKGAGAKRIVDAARAPFALIRKSTRWSPFGEILKIKPSSTGGSWVLVRCHGGCVWLLIESE
jgi:methionyl-tRNA formyltransferase